VLVVLMIWYHVPPSPFIVFLPVVVLVQVMFTAAVSLFVAMANLFYRDVKYLFEVVMMLWMFSTSVFYPVENMGGRLGRLLRLNPMTAILDAYRDVLFSPGRLPGLTFALAAVVAVVALAVAWVLFHRSESEFAERI